MWRDAEEDAIRVGLSLDYFWTLNPKQFQKYINVFQEKEERRLKEKDTLNYVLGKYIAFAVNDPKHYPKKPFCELNAKPKVMTDEEMERQALRNTFLIGGVVNDS